MTGGNDEGLKLPPMKDVVVIGGGIVGVCAAVVLARAGREVVVIERGDIGGATSFGNAGVMADSYVAVANNPDLWRRLPSIIFGRAPECRLSFRYALGNLPWLLAFLRRANYRDAAAAAAAISGLLRLSLPLHKTLIADAGCGELLNERGWLKVFRSEKGFALCRSEMHLLERLNVHHHIMDGAQLAQLEPALKPVFAKALFFPHDISVNNPGELTTRYGELLRAAGGTIIRAETTALLPNNKNGWQVQLNNAPTINADNVVVAAGPWSAKLLKTADIKIPMAWERGYHCHFAAPSANKLTRPVLDRQRGYYLAPMAHGYRLTTGDEFAAMDAPPDFRQLQYCRQYARQITTMGDAPDKMPWLGSRPTLPDSLPMIGAAADKKGLWFNFGHHHIGLSSAPGSALLLSALMNQQTPPVNPKPFSPARF